MSSFPTPVTEVIAPNPLRIEPRPRLFAAMDDLCASPILWVGGPPGSGKTAGVAGYLSARGLASTWYRVGAEDDASPLAPQFALRDSLQRLSPTGVLVIDDCHRFNPTALLELASAGVLLCSTGLRLILIGRGEAPSSLAPLIVKGLVATLPPSSLHVCIAEMQDWAARHKVDPSALAPWYEKCAGWTLGITTALERLRREPDDPLRACETAKKELFAYFSAEVFEHTTANVRRIIACAALPARCSCQMTEALSGQPDAHEELARIVARDGFVTRSTAAPISYQFMPLYREFILSRIADTFAPVELKEMAVRASSQLEKNPDEGWLGDCELLEAYGALCRGAPARCHHLLRTALPEADYSPDAALACAVFPDAVARLCNEALRESIAPESARRLIVRHRLPAPAGAAGDWPWPYKVYVLGHFRLLKGNAPIRFSRRAQRKPLELLQALIAFGATEVPARALIDALWPDSEGDAGYHAMESALYRLRQLLEAPDAVRMASGRLSLDRSQFWVDMWELERELQSAHRGDPDLEEHVVRIRQLYEGPFLEHDTDRPWSLKTRQLLHDRFSRYMRDAARVYESRNLWQDAAKVYQSGLELDSLNEDLYRGLMVCHRELGDHSEALHAYRRCRELLTKFLGIPPNAKTQAVYFSVRERAVTSASASMQ